jgi:UDP-2-acetamido-3-amino-2,3-dideoxy-glucuronate N-acetyltransferase
MTIHSSFTHGNNFKCGENVIIESDVTVGDDVHLGHNVTLKSGTVVLNNVELADYVMTTGVCIIGNNVAIRTGACISRSVIINDCVFVGPGIMTNHTRNVMHMRPAVKEVQMITNIGYGTIIGSMCQILAGINIGDNVSLAAGTNVYYDIMESGVYGGYPLRKIKELDQSLILKRPKDYISYSFTEEQLRKYLPKWIGFQGR